MYSTLASVDSRPKIPATPLLFINQCLLLILEKNNPALNQTEYFSRFPWPAMEGKSEKRCDGRGMVTELAQKICHTLP